MKQTCLPAVLFLAVLIPHPGLPAGTLTVNVYPDAVNVRAGSTKQFGVGVSNAANTAVTWWVNGVQSGNATVGTISATGLYTAPATVPVANLVTVKAVSAADTTKFDTSAVTLWNPTPQVTSVYPPQVNIGAFALTLTGTNFVKGAKVMWDTLSLPVNFVSGTELRVTGTTTQVVGTYVPLTVVNPNPGSATSYPKNIKILEPVSVNVYPDTKTLRCGTFYDFSASVYNHVDKTVKWYVNGVAGGNATLGLIDGTGLYTVPVLCPGATVSIKAVSQADTTKSDTSTVTLQNPIPVLISVNPAAVKIGTFTIQLKGTGFAKMAKARIGETPLTTAWVSTSEITATGTASPVTGGKLAILVDNPDPGHATSNPMLLGVDPVRNLVSRSVASRLLEQATWGPTPDSLAALQANGVDSFFNEQFNAPMSTYPDPPDDSAGLSAVQKAFFSNAMTKPDQLRQRMAFALGQILVISGNKTGRWTQVVPYNRILLKHAFGNYKDLLKDVTLSPTMGRFLDMVDNDKPNPKTGVAPNENYGRELLQLFSLGLYELNQDGSRAMNNGLPVPAYDEATVKQFALALTGWTYPTRPGYSPKWRNPSYYLAPMEPWDDHHDMSQKTLLKGRVLPPGQTARADLDAVIDNIFTHPNVGPFVALRLIQRLTTSNPSPAYISRVAGVFNNNGAGVRGDLKAVAKAILMDADAGNQVPPPALVTGSNGLRVVTPSPSPALPADQGHLREPVLFALSVLRALDATVTAEPSLAYQTREMGQDLFFPPSVFNYFSPFYRIAGTASLGPEFQLLTAATASNRANFVYAAVRNGISSTVQVDLSNLIGLAADPNALVDAVGNALLRGQMSAEQRASILTAMQATTDLRTRARNALYLAATSSQYQVQR